MARIRVWLASSDMAMKLALRGVECGARFRVGACLAPCPVATTGRPREDVSSLGSFHIDRCTPPMPTTRPSAALRATTILLLAAAFALPARALTLLTVDIPPSNYTENGKLTGLVAELVLETMKRAHVPFTVEVLPWTRAYMRTQAEKDT